MSRYTTHASHAMGVVDGEACCVVCYAAPWMAIIEDACATCDISPQTRASIIHGRNSSQGRAVPHLTLDQVREATRMRQARASWDEISLAIGRPAKSIQRAVRDLREGRGRLAARAAQEARDSHEVVS